MIFLAFARSPVRRRASHGKGAVTVEFAFVLPIFLLFVFAVIEFSRLNTIRHAVDNAAYEAARKAIVPGATAEQAETVATAYLNDVLDAKGYTVTVTPDPITEDTTEVNVQVDIPLDQNLWAKPVYSDGMVVSGQSTLRTERYRGIPTQ